MLAKFEYMMWVMHGMFGIVTMLFFHNHNIQATYPTAFSVQNLSIILQAAHVMPDCGRRQAFFSSLQKGDDRATNEVACRLFYRLSGLPQHRYDYCNNATSIPFDILTIV